MEHRRSWAPVAWLAVIIAVGAGLIATMVLARAPAAGQNAGPTPAPAHIEPLEGSDVSRVKLEQRAAERLDIKTAPVAADSSSIAGSLVIPYSALLYDAEGATWVYTSPQPLEYVRAPVTVAAIRGEQVFLSAGPEPGTMVVVTGAAEIFGTEFGVGH